MNRTKIDVHRRPLLFMAMAVPMIMTCSPVVLAEGSVWKNLWTTPHQQKLQLEQNGNYDVLVNEPDAPAWNGVGNYRSGDFAAAATNFADSDDPAARYNHATSLTRAGDYEAALDLYDDILKDNPQHEKAAQNKAITEQLQQLQQQQQQQQQQEGENSQDQEGENQQGDSGDGEQQDGDQSSEQQEGEEQDSSQQNGDEQSGNQEGEQQDQQAQDGDETDQSEAESAAEEQPVESETEEPSDEEAQTETAGLEDASMTEDQQATEQWLRRIPDDPTGLLRRKLQRSHSTDFPGVGDSASPW